MGTIERSQFAGSPAHTLIWAWPHVFKALPASGHLSFSSIATELNRMEIEARRGGIIKQYLDCKAVFNSAQLPRYVGQGLRSLNSVLSNFVCRARINCAHLGPMQFETGAT